MKADSSYWVWNCFYKAMKAITFLIFTLQTKMEVSAKEIVNSIIYILFISTSNSILLRCLIMLSVIIREKRVIWSSLAWFVWVKRRSWSIVMPIEIILRLSLLPALSLALAWWMIKCARVCSQPIAWCSEFALTLLHFDLSFYLIISPWIYLNQLRYLVIRAKNILIKIINFIAY